jgi:two-component system, NtrC family, sensor kinase
LATLIVLQGPDKGRTLRADDQSVLVGRGSPQVPLTDQTVSRQHAELQRVEGGWLLVDLDSANGTYLNGVRVLKATRLKHGDQIRVGSTLLVYAGDESVQQYTGAGIPTDLITLDAGSLQLDSAVVASVPSNEDSIIMAAPEAVNAVKAWKVMRELTEVIGSLLPPNQLLARALDIIYQEMEVDHGMIFVRDAESGELLPEVVRFRGLARAREADHTAITASRTIMSHVVSSREGVLCSNVVADKRFQSGKSVQNLGMRSVICAPIVAREHVLGVIHLDCSVTRHTYNEAELRLVTATGFQTGLAMENARLVEAHLQRERLAAAGETVAYLSHYIKNILQGMRSGAEVVQRGLDRRDLVIAAQGWSIVERNLDRSYNLMLNMLAFSKDRAPRLEPVQLNRVVEDVVSLVQKQVDDKRVVLLTELDDALPAAPLDYDGVHQVLLNLVTNAIDAIERERGIINVRTSYLPAERSIVVSVTDNGPGVPPERRGTIFDAFQSSKGQGGTGLGLAVARKIVHELGGSLTVADPPDGGAEFRVRLPAVREEPTAAGDTRGPAR